MGIPILYGRAIDERDIVRGPRAVVVNREFGRYFFQRENTVGITFVDADKVTYQIVGVCEDWRVDRLRDEMRPSVYALHGAGASCWSGDLRGEDCRR